MTFTSKDQTIIAKFIEKAKAHKDVETIYEYHGLAFGDKIDIYRFRFINVQWTIELLNDVAIYFDGELI